MLALEPGEPASHRERGCRRARSKVALKPSILASAEDTAHRTTCLWPPHHQARRMNAGAGVGESSTESQPGDFLSWWTEGLAGPLGLLAGTCLHRHSRGEATAWRPPPWLVTLLAPARDRGHPKLQ